MDGTECSSCSEHALMVARPSPIPIIVMIISSKCSYFLIASSSSPSSFPSNWIIYHCAVFCHFQWSPRATKWNHINLDLCFRNQQKKTHSFHILHRHHYQLPTWNDVWWNYKLHILICVCVCILQKQSDSGCTHAVRWCCAIEHLVCAFNALLVWKTWLISSDSIRHHINLSAFETKRALSPSLRRWTASNDDNRHCTATT